jgi:hypothetical protein
MLPLMPAHNWAGFFIKKLKHQLEIFLIGLKGAKGRISPIFLKYRFMNSSYRRKLFDHFDQQYDLQLSDGEINEIIDLASTGKDQIYYYKKDPEQITLFQLLTSLKTEPESFEIGIDFNDKATPAFIISYRGDYEDIAVEYEFVKPGESGISVRDFINRIERAGPFLHGYKGGLYPVDLRCPMWVAQDGEVSRRVITGIRRKNRFIEIQTKIVESIT